MLKTVELQHVQTIWNHLNRCKCSGFGSDPTKGMAEDLGAETNEDLLCDRLPVPELWDGLNGHVPYGSLWQFNP